MNWKLEKKLESDRNGLFLEKIERQQDVYRGDMTFFQKLEKDKP